jgi:glycosyltransferase involved in cell wall biosynthesis
MKIWFVHQNFPGQYRNLAPYFAARPDHEVVAIGETLRAKVEGVHQFAYEAPRPGSRSTHPYIRDLETAVRRGQQTARLATDLKNKGFTPDIVCSHPGWGETLYFKDIFPDAKFLSYFEFYYHPHGADTGFDPEFSRISLNALARTRTKNTVNLLTLEMADRGVCPTEWQCQQFPTEFRSKLCVIHDGIDSEVVKPNANASVTVKRDDKIFTVADEIITYVARNLEPYRGFHIFMRSLPELMARRPKAHFLIIGGDDVSYGQELPNGKTYREMMLEEVGGRIDFNRLHILGRVPYSQFLNLLQISSLHVYLTYPFVLSWSFLEAMASGCLIVASKTPPVEEFITDGENGLLFDFFSPEELCAVACRALNDKDFATELKKNARAKIVGEYDLKKFCLPKQVRLIEEVVSGGRNPASGAIRNHRSN